MPRPLFPGRELTQPGGSGAQSLDPRSQEKVPPVHAAKPGRPVMARRVRPRRGCRERRAPPRPAVGPDVAGVPVPEGGALVAGPVLGGERERGHRDPDRQHLRHSGRGLSRGGGLFSRVRGRGQRQGQGEGSGRDS